MPTRLAMLAAVALAACAAAASAQTRATAANMPSVERVRAEITGATPMETAARQMGAFWQLRRIIETLAGPRFDRGQLAPEENRLRGEDNNAYAQAGQPYAQLQGDQRPKWFQMHSFYETDDKFRDELLDWFVSPALPAEEPQGQRHRGHAIARSQSGSATGTGARAGTITRVPPPAAPATNPPARGADAPRVARRAAQSHDQSRQDDTGGRPSRLRTNCVCRAAQTARDEFTKGEARYKAAAARYNADDYAAAIDHFKKSIAIEPASATYYLLGRSQFKKGLSEDALSSFTKAGQLAPAHAGTRHQLGETYDWLGQPDKAEAAYLEAIRLDPRSAARLTALGVFYMKRHRDDEAMALYKKAATIDERTAQDILLARGMRGEAERAIASAREALEATRTKGTATSAPTALDSLLAEAKKHERRTSTRKRLRSRERQLPLTPDRPMRSSTQVRATTG